MMNTIEKFLMFALMIILVGLILRYYKGATEIGKVAGGTLIDIFKVLSLQPTGRVSYGYVPYPHTA
ncbi:MAG: hypothetical protein QXF82_00815 [Nitrososphaeria archaeon]